MMLPQSPLAEVIVKIVPSSSFGRNPARCIRRGIADSSRMHCLGGNSNPRIGDWANSLFTVPLIAPADIPGPLSPRGFDAPGSYRLFAPLAFCSQ
jgi:hypothetical protein